MTGRVAFVTGGSRGIGRAVCLALAEGGHRVAVCYHESEKAAAEVCADVEGQGGSAIAVQADVADADAVDSAFSQVEQAWGPVQVLVANAGINRDGLILRMDAKQWADVVRTNLDGAFHAVRRAAPGMLRSRFGRIVTVGSIGGLSGSAGQANYAAAKAGLIGLTRAAARELGSRNITANVVTPGPIVTDMTEALSDEQRRQMVERVPMGRFGTVEEVASVVAFLCSEPASYVNGAVVAVDGGMGMGH